MPKIRLLEVAGEPEDLGFQHGLAYPDEIRELTVERVRLSSNIHWTGQELSRREVLALAEACLRDHQAYAPELMAELQGLSRATGLELADLMILNGFTDFIDTVYSAGSGGGSRPSHPNVDNCTSFIVSAASAASGQGFYGQTWDMHATATPYVLLLRGRPSRNLRFLTLTLIGCVGMIGMNEAGIAVGINNLTAGDGRTGVTWPFVIRKVLAQDNLDDALTCITGARLAGGHNYMLVDESGRGFNVEAMATRCHIKEVTQGTMAHTNHCLAANTIELERPRLPQSQRSSQSRLSEARRLLGREQITLEDLFLLTRSHKAGGGICAHPEEPFFVESCGAAIMQPATREMWVVWGKPCQNNYERFVI